VLAVSDIKAWYRCNVTNSDRLVSCSRSGIVVDDTTPLVSLLDASDGNIYVAFLCQADPSASPASYNFAAQSIRPPTMPIPVTPPDATPVCPLATDIVDAGDDEQSLLPNDLLDEDERHDDQTYNYLAYSDSCYSSQSSGSSGSSHPLPPKSQHPGMMDARSVPTRPHNFKTKMCRDIPNCKFGALCWFAHSEDELVGFGEEPLPANWKTKMCANGPNCKFAHTCWFAHSPSELRLASDPLPTRKALYPSHTPGILPGKKAHQDRRRRMGRGGQRSTGVKPLLTTLQRAA